MEPQQTDRVSIFIPHDLSQASLVIGNEVVIAIPDRILKLYGLVINPAKPTK